MKLGFTGTQVGMTDAQREAVADILVEGWRRDWWEEFHHGDCIGADEQAHDIANARIRIVVHPPLNSVKRAYCLPAKGGEVLPARPYLERNHDIVNATDEMLAAPAGPERQRSGTWATVRYARKLGRRVRIVWPDGRVEG